LAVAEDVIIVVVNNGSTDSPLSSLKWVYGCTASTSLDEKEALADTTLGGKDHSFSSARVVHTNSTTSRCYFCASFSVNFGTIHSDDDDDGIDLDIDLDDEAKQDLMDKDHQHWMPDELCKQYYSCGTHFTSFSSAPLLLSL
jgi:hypothetical protein